MNGNLYPQSPELDNYNFIKPSKAFKSVAISVIISILLFLLFYLILLAISVAILALSIWGSITIIALNPNFLTLGAGFGLIALGVMFFIFLVKFIFSRTRNENPYRIELKKEECPELFDFIKKLTEDTKTKFPKKIFISPDVNAMVFYNSSFWSLFLPVRKNLEIGLGLVNILNISEFKSVLAHEFGHFSQRSMKIGSYIYTVNRVIYNLVYEYDSWDNLLAKWAEAGSIFGFFARITFWMVERVRSLLKIAYNWINIYYLKLSREMEYHADLVAISVSGNEAFKNALRKIEFSSFAFEYTTSYLNALANKQKATRNLYIDHQFTISYLANHNQLSSIDGVLHITDEDLEKNLIKPRVNVKDQWASHPALKEREKNIAKVDIVCNINKEPVWKLFKDAIQLQVSVTENLYRTGFPENNFEKLSDHEFEEYVNAELNKYKISEAYHGFYDGRYLTEFEFKELIDAKESVDCFSDIYGRENVEIIKRFHTNQVDLEVLGQISLKKIGTKYFEFDGKKYKRKEASSLIKSLKQEIQQEAKAIEELDKRSFQLNYQLSKQYNLEKELVEKYASLFSCQNTIKNLDDICIKFQNFANSLYSQSRWTEEQINLLLIELSTIEKEFKDFLGRRDINAMLGNVEDQSQGEIIKEYVKNGNFYCNLSEFDEEGFINLSNLISCVQTAYGITYGKTLKDLTDFQLQFQTKANDH